MTDRAINTERNYSAGTENLRKSGHAICECRHQVSYVGNTIMQGKDSESQIDVEKIFFPIWLQPQVWSNSSLPWLRSHQVPHFHPFATHFPKPSTATGLVLSVSWSTNPELRCNQRAKWVYKHEV